MGTCEDNPTGKVSDSHVESILRVLRLLQQGHSRHSEL